MKKPNTSIVAPAIALAAAFFTAPALAGNNVFKQGEADGDSDYLASNSANWWQPGQVSTDVDTGVTTITEMSFSNPYVTTFDKMIKTGTYIWVGSTGTAFDGDNAFAVWRAKDDSADCGISQTAGDLPIADASTQKGKLKIESGTYEIKNDLKVGANGGNATLVMTGGTLRVAYWLTAGRSAASTSAIEVHGGTLTTAYRDNVEQTGNTGNGMIDLSSCSGSTATLKQTGGRIHCAGSNNSGDKYIAMSVGNGSGANASVEMTGGELDVDGTLDVPRLGNGTFIIKGGSVDVLGNNNIGCDASGSGVFAMTGGTWVNNSYTCVGCGGNGTFEMSGGTYTQTANAFIVGQGDNAADYKGVANVTGGTLAVPQLWISENEQCGEMTLSGEANVSVSGAFYAARDSNEATDATLVVSNATFTVGGESFIANAAGSKATVTVTDGGEYISNADMHVGHYGSATLSVTNNGVVTCQTAAGVALWVKFNSGEAAGQANAINIVDGGVFNAWHFERYGSDGTAVINMDGGTIKALGSDSNYNKHLIGNRGSGAAAITVTVTGEGGTIDSDGHDIAMTLSPISGDGSFTKAGDGTLTITEAANTYTGKTIVKGGSLVLGSNATLASTELLLDGGTLSGATFDNIVISSGDYSFSGIPVNTTGTVTLTGGILRMTVAEAQATADTAKVVVNGGTLLIDGSTAESVAEGSSFTFGNVTLGDDVEAANVVKVSGVNFDWTYGSSDGHPTATAGTASGENVWVGGAEGYWKDNINWTYGVPATGATARFDTDATVLFDANKTIASIVVNATVMFKSTDLGSVHPTVYIHDVDGTGTIQLYHVGFEGNGGDKRIGSSSDNTLTLEFAVASTDSWLKYVNVYAPVTGSGYARFYDGTMLYGDNSAFTGTIKKDDGDTRFMAPEAGFPNASAVTIDGTIWLWFDEGEIEFGGTFTAYATGNCGFNLPGTVKAVTMTVGGGNGSVILSRGYDRDHRRWYNYYSAFIDANGWQQGTDKFTLRKVGTGAITEYGVQSVYNFSLEGGSVNLGASDVYTGPDTRLTVTNATLGIAAATTVASADFQSGSTLQSTYYETTEEETTTYGVNLLTVTGAATLNGLTLTAVGPTPNVDTTYTVLSAASVSGSAESGVADSDETDKKVWIARVRQNSVKLMYGSKTPGFFVVIH